MPIGGPSMRELFGITGLPEGPRIQGGVTPQDINGFARIGRQSTSPQAQFPTTLNSRFNYNKILGRHNLKAGHEWLHLAIAVDDTNPLYGIDAYGGGYSRLTPGATNVGLLAGRLLLRRAKQLSTRDSEDRGCPAVGKLVLHSGRLESKRPPHAEPRRALRDHDPDVRGEQRGCQLRPGNAPA